MLSAPKHFPIFLSCHRAVIVEASQPTSGGLANVVKLVVGTPSWPSPKQTPEIAGQFQRGHAVQVVLRECAGGACCSFKQFAAWNHASCALCRTFFFKKLNKPISHRVISHFMMFLRGTSTGTFWAWWNVIVLALAEVKTFLEEKHYRQLNRRFCFLGLLWAFEPL